MHPTAMAFALILGPVFGHDFNVAPDAGWCWIADPRAIRVDRRIIAGGVTSAGDVAVSEFDLSTGKQTTFLLAPKLQKDDHNNPALLELPDGRIAAFFCKHNGNDLFVRYTEKSSDISTWTPAKAISPNDPAFKGPKGFQDNYTYPNPVLLSAEKNRIYLTYRGMNWKPTISWSDDLGNTWSPGRILFEGSGAPDNRPYFKVASNGIDRIHFAFTDGHPRNEPTNSIYYAQYAHGTYFRADGSRIASFPIKTQDADVVYDGKAENCRAWIWDVGEDPKGRPVVVYARLPKEDQHVYRYAWWNGKRWVDRQIVEGGKWFAKTPEGKKEQEPHYSGGIALDHEDPRVVYLSRPVGERWEIERWFTPDGGESWSHVAITGNSKHDSVRPFVVPGPRKPGDPAVLFVNAVKYVHYTDYNSRIQGAKEDRGSWSEKTNPADIRRVMSAVWRWTRSNPYRHAPTDWTMAPLYVGVIEAGKALADKEPVDWVRSIGQGAGWKFGPRPLMADDQAVGQAYLDLFALDKDPAQMAAAKAWGDALLSRSASQPLNWDDKVHNTEWAWCDALFMAPPVLAQLARESGNRDYLLLMDRLWWKTSDYLYDPSEQLFFRDSRYFEPREANGKKVFWSRGNGWVLAGLARLMSAMPVDDPLRPKFEKQFKEMAARLAKLQGEDGAWRSSLLDPDAYPAPESSGTAFYCYAMAWGINNGLLDAKAFRPVVDKAWAALVRRVDLNGRLGYIQPIGQDPRKIGPTDNDSYGVGGLLMAGAEILKN